MWKHFIFIGVVLYLIASWLDQEMHNAFMQESEQLNQRYQEFINDPDNPCMQLYRANYQGELEGDLAKSFKGLFAEFDKDKDAIFDEVVSYGKSSSSFKQFEEGMFLNKLNERMASFVASCENLTANYSK